MNPRMADRVHWWSGVLDALLLRTRLVGWTERSARFSGRSSADEGHRGWDSDDIRFVKWASMFLVLFWVIVFRLSESLEKLPEFVYVNF